MAVILPQPTRGRRAAGGQPTGSGRRTPAGSTHEGPGRVVHEDVGAATVLSDEAEALLSVEPLHRTLCHAVSSVGDVLQPTLCRPDVLSCVPTLELALTSGARKHRMRGRIRRLHDRSTQETLNCSLTSMP